MHLNLGILGSVYMEPLQEEYCQEGLVITHSGHTDMGIRVHCFENVIKDKPAMYTGMLWNNAIMIELEG